MRKLCTIGLVLLVTFAALAGLLSSREEALAAAEDNRATVEVCHGCEEEDGGWFTSFHTCNTGNSRAEYRVEYRRDDDVVAVTSGQLDPLTCRSRTAGVEEGFDGVATIDASPGVRVILGRSENPDGTGASSAHLVPMSPLDDGTGLQGVARFRSYTGPRVDVPELPVPEVDVASLLCNAGSGSAETETSAILQDGGDPGSSRDKRLDSRDCGAVDLTAGLTPAEADRLAGGRIITDTIWVDGYDTIRFGPDDVADIVPGQTRDQAGSVICMPLIFEQQEVFADNYSVRYSRGSLSVQNIGSESVSVFTSQYDAAGNLLDGGSRGLGPGASARWEIAPDTSFCAGSVGGSLSGLGMYFGRPDDSSDMGPDTAPEDSGHRFDAIRLPDDPVTKRALLAGAVRRERRTRVNVVMHNLTDRRTKARMIVRDGDGDRIFARTLRAPGRATVRRKFVPRARGDDLWVEVKVRGGKKEVYLWLQRVDPSGDVTLYPAIEVR